MMLGGYGRQFYRDFKAHKMRTGLTTLGIAWGTVAVTLLLAFGGGLQKQVTKDVRDLGENIVIAWPARTSKPFQGLPVGRRINVSEEDLELLRKEIPELERVSAEYSRGDLKVKLGRKIFVPSLVGVEPDFSLIRNMDTSEGGRFLDPLDMAERKRVVYLGDKLKEDLFGESQAVGSHVLIGGMPFLVVGVMQKKEQDSNYNGRDSDKGSIPSATYRTLFGEKYVDDFVFKAIEERKTQAVKDRIYEILGRKHRFSKDDKEAIGMWDTTEEMHFMNTFFMAFRIFLGVVGSFTLVVGGIGVSNIMNLVVEERMKEIGIKMALGARKRYVLAQFLFETFLFTLMGGALGFLVSHVLCSVFPLFKLQKYVGVPVISLNVAVITIAILGLIGFLAGYFPARAAANMNPVEALRL
jgi:putative ABC transport system permease protein